MTSTLLLPLLIHLRGCLARNSIRHDQLGLFLSPLSTWEGFVRDSGTYLDQFCFDLADTQERDVVVHLAIVDGIDVTIRSGLGPWPGHTAEFLMRYHVTPICSPDFLAANDINEPADLLRVQRLAQDDPWWAGWFAEAGIALPPAPPAASILFDSQLEEARMAGAGFGAALMTPVFWAEEIATGRLVQPFPTLYFPPFSLWLVRPEGRTGVLIYVSFAERFAEVIADAGIYQKVAPSTWEDVVGELTNHLAGGSIAEGFIRAVERCGKILAKYFPPGTANPNELPNHLIILDAYGRP